MTFAILICPPSATKNRHHHVELLYVSCSPLRGVLETPCTYALLDGLLYANYVRVTFWLCCVTGSLTYPARTPVWRFPGSILVSGSSLCLAKSRVVRAFSSYSFETWKCASSAGASSASPPGSTYADRRVPPEAAPTTTWRWPFWPPRRHRRPRPTGPPGYGDPTCSKTHH